MKKIGLTLLTAIVGGAMALGTYKLVENKYANNMSLDEKQEVYFANNKMTSNIMSSAGQLDFTQAAAAVTPAVVFIRTTYNSSSGMNSEQSQAQRLMEEFLGRGGGGRQARPQMASGSGVIISPDGYIVTNNHVVAKADKIDITLNDHRQFKAKVIGTDPNTDLALIKIEGNNLPVVKMGNSDDVRVGEWVLAVGNPFNLTSTVTAGIVSAKGRGLKLLGRPESGEEEEYGNPFGGRLRRQTQPEERVSKGIESFIQTDAAINPGNSGGALVNTAGELIGINSAIASHTGTYEGYGFAIPMNLARKVLNDIQKYGAVKRGYIGVSFLELNPDYAEQLNVKSTAGLYVNEVLKGSGGEAAGLRKGDVISKVEGKPVYESSDLQERAGRLQPGDKIKVSVLRDGEEKNFTITLKADADEARTANSSKSTAELYNKLGASFIPLTQAEKSQLRVNSGVKVTQIRPGGMFADLEMSVGSVITSINRQPINSMQDVDKAMSSIRDGQILISGRDADGVAFNNRFQLAQ
ncbi:MAG: trypsin-like peptidase domain-containing protein [Bacteroidota bacterium]